MNQLSIFPYEAVAHGPRCLSRFPFAPLTHDPSSQTCGPCSNRIGSLVLDRSFRRNDPRAFEGIPGQYLADALSVWDSYRGAWLSGAPTVLRFEECDIVASRSARNSLAFWQGALDTDRRVEMTDPLLNKDLADRFCPTWRSNPSFSPIIGMQALQVRTAGDKRLVIDFEKGRLVIECSPNGIGYRWE